MLADPGAGHRRPGCVTWSSNWRTNLRVRDPRRNVGLVATLALHGAPTACSAGHRRFGARAESWSTQVTRDATPGAGLPFLLCRDAQRAARGVRLPYHRRAAQGFARGRAGPGLVSGADGAVRSLGEDLARARAADAVRPRPLRLPAAKLLHLFALRVAVEAFQIERLSLPHELSALRHLSCRRSKSMPMPRTRLTGSAAGAART